MEMEEWKIVLKEQKRLSPSNNLMGQDLVLQNYYHLRMKSEELGRSL